VLMTVWDIKIVGKIKNYIWWLILVEYENMFYNYVGYLDRCYGFDISKYVDI
jgi:hypothetical protein